MAAVAEALGQPLMPWQRFVADVGTELLADGRPAYREIIVTIPRQSGKTTLTLAFEMQRALAWQSAQRIAYTAQTGSDARKKLLDDQVPIIMASTLRHAVDRVHRAQGNEAVIFKGGSRIDVLASSDSAGHGKTIDLGVIDEAFADIDDRREQAILPAMATRRAAQMIVVSTAGTDASAYLRRKVDAGRSAVDRGENTGIAYFEWSSDFESADPDDPRTWWSCMPALGHTITEDVVRHARQTMSDGDFRRSMLNQWTVAAERLIPATVWESVCRHDAEPNGRLFFAVDVNPERSAAAIVVAGDADKPTVEVIEHRPGVSWAVDRVVEIAGRRQGSTVTVDARGPAASLVPQLEQAGVRVVGLSPGEVAAACAAFFDDLADSKIQIRRHLGLDAAAAAATRQVSGDSWRFARRDGSDITPLMAAVLASWSATRRRPVSPRPAILDPWSVDA